ncbi:carboxy-S-adenosyl-L-methionine synthase CmoA [Alteromonas sediminis]|uniref:Carboxy-S-adenosyl-L-methionine synthase n=1 Tax=Alteromonas sediminis TaxID=2259342 RepID=A0A3N5YD88_9ALTE|nr:carboxy-S-adenosyl-L-methionine synthase CmoA [Alteromonas sediminis]RPJ67475.1 carboxy-S-adenosyl-L-methionine synthase CmoA [Alteromonas sediminis]
MSQKDNIYAQKTHAIDDFRFDDTVADVFPDMINRSVPGYKTITHSAGRIAQRYVAQGDTLYDIGCSLGETSLSISRALPNDFCHIVAIDNAQAMVERCKRIVRQYALPNPIDVVCDDAQRINYECSGLICLNFTLQFIPREQRASLLSKLATALKPGGALLLSEKIRHPTQAGNELLIDLHHAFKRDNGYSELEIAQKRAAIENVMKTDTLDTHKQRLLEAGFDDVIVWYQNYNFVSMVAEKHR